MDNIYKCTRCKKTFDDMRVEINLETNVDRLRADHQWESIANLSLVSKEVLCPDCFYIFADQLGALNMNMAAKESALDGITPVQQQSAKEIVHEVDVVDNVIPPAEEVVNDSDPNLIPEPQITYADQPEQSAPDVSNAPRQGNLVHTSTQLKRVDGLNNG